MAELEFLDPDWLAPGAFVAAVLGSADAIWKDVFTKDGLTYRSPRLVMFSGGTSSGCGEAQSAMGPFYCPNDQRVYLDTSFFRDLDNRFGAPGDFGAVAGGGLLDHLPTLAPRPPCSGTLSRQQRKRLLERQLCNHPVPQAHEPHDLKK